MKHYIVLYSHGKKPSRFRRFFRFRTAGIVAGAMSLRKREELGSYVQVLLWIQMRSQTDISISTYLHLPTYIPTYVLFKTVKMLKR